MNVLHPWRDVRPWQRHSLVLMVAGWVFVLLGTALMTTPVSATTKVALQLALSWMPMEAWGVVFIAAGLLTAISSRWPPVSETWGYMVLTGLSALWAGFYLMGVMFFDAPSSALSGFLLWAMLAFMWWAIGGLVNPTERELGNGAHRRR